MTINRKLQFFAIRIRRGCRRPWLFAVCALLALAPCAPASINIPTPPENKKTEKWKDAPAPPPPQPVPMTVQVPNGATVRVALRVYGRQEQTTRFLIRNEPKLGKIVALEPVDREVWILTYQHTSAMNGQLSLQDRILFAAQNKNGTSSAAEITLSIVDNPPELASPGPVEFGEIAAGVASTRSVTLANAGGGVLEGSVMADPPWSAEPAGYKLARGQQATLRLSVTPGEEREYQGRLHFSSDPKAEPALHATAFAPFTVEPASLELAADPKTPGRAATFTLTNRTDAELTLQVEANARLQLPGQIVLSPKAVQTLQVALAADDPGGIEGTVRLSLGTMFRLLSVHAASNIPPQAEPSPTPAIQATPTPARMANYLPTFPTSPPLTPNTRNPPDADPAAFNAAVANALGSLEELPKITGFAVVRTTSDGTAEFAWERPPLPASCGELTYRVEVRRLSLDESGKLLQTWISVPDVRFSKKGNLVTGRITGIPPGISDTAHIVALSARNEPCAASFPLAFRIPAPVQLFTLRNGLLAGFSLLLILALALRLREKLAK